MQCSKMAESHCESADRCTCMLLLNVSTHIVDNLSATVATTTVKKIANCEVFKLTIQDASYEGYSITSNLDIGTTRTQRTAHQGVSDWLEQLTENNIASERLVRSIHSNKNK
jgi:hypothetical protein